MEQRCGAEAEGDARESLNGGKSEANTSQLILYEASITLIPKQTDMT